MRAIKLWSSADLDERIKSGNPPPEWVKEAIYFNDENAVSYFEKLGYTVLTDSEYDNYLLSNQSSFQNYINSGYKDIEQFNFYYHQNEQKIVSGKQFLLKFKLKNLSEGIKWPQAVWLHHRIKSWQVNVTNSGAFEVDLMNVIMSGDLESAIYMLKSGTPDDMTQPYHWITKERIDWAIDQLQSALASNN